MGLKLLASDGSFLFSGVLLNLLVARARGFCCDVTQLLKNHSNQSLAFGPNCLMNSVWVSFRHVALPFFGALTSAALNGLVYPGSLAYRC